MKVSNMNFGALLACLLLSAATPALGASAREFQSLVNEAHAKYKDLKEGAQLAARAIDSGEAEGRLDRLIAVSNAPAPE